MEIGGVSIYFCAYDKNTELPVMVKKTIFL